MFIYSVDTGVKSRTPQNLESKMQERPLKKKTRGDSPTNSVEEQEATGGRTENEQSISYRDFSEISEKVERSVCRRIREIETTQREILKMIKKLSSKIDSLSEGNPKDVNTGINEFHWQSENVASTSRNCETESMFRDEGLYTSETSSHTSETHLT